MIKTSTRPIVAGFGDAGSWRRQGLLRNAAVAAAFLLVLVSALASTAFSQSRGPKSVADLAEKLQDAVVNISTTQTLKGTKGVPLPRIPKGSPFEEFFEDFFNRQQRSDRPRQVNSLGSGFVIDPSGLIVTNNHVIDGADEIFIKFSDNTKLKVVEVVGTDAKTDLALLRVKPEKPLVALEFGDSTKMRVGDWVMAIGNPFGLGGTVTLGIISAKKRDINSGPYDEFIQTDAAINRGNSGGPLFDMEGKVIGVNTAIISPSGGSIGIGFAVPVDTARRVVPDLIEFGTVRRGWIEIIPREIIPQIAAIDNVPAYRGLLVSQVEPGGNADEAGLEGGSVDRAVRFGRTIIYLGGDIIIEVDGTEVNSVANLYEALEDNLPGETVSVTYLRNNRSRETTVTLVERPARFQWD